MSAAYSRKVLRASPDIDVTKGGIWIESKGCLDCSSILSLNTKPASNTSSGTTAHALLWLGAVRGYEGYRGDVDVRGGLFFSVRGHKWMVWAYFRHPYTNELWYIRTLDLWDYDVYPTDGLHCYGDWDVYVDWVYQDTVNGVFDSYYDWRSSYMYIEFAGDFVI